MNRCLVIVDTQRDFINPATEQMLSQIHNLVSKSIFDKVVATQFINPANSLFRTQLDYHGNSYAEITIDTTILKATDKIFRKTGYSCVTKEFMQYINRNLVSTIYLAGLNTDSGIISTAMDLFSRGIHCKVIEDCCTSFDGSYYHDFAIDILKRNIGEHNICTSLCL